MSPSSPPASSGARARRCGQKDRPKAKEDALCNLHGYAPVQASKLFSLGFSFTRIPGPFLILKPLHAQLVAIPRFSGVLVGVVHGAEFTWLNVLERSRAVSQCYSFMRTTRLAKKR